MNRKLCTSTQVVFVFLVGKCVIEKPKPEHVDFDFSSGVQ